MIMASLVPSIPATIARARIALRCARGPLCAWAACAVPSLLCFRWAREGSRSCRAPGALDARTSTGCVDRAGAPLGCLRAASLVDVGIGEAEHRVDILAMLGRRLQDRALVEAVEGSERSSTRRPRATCSNPGPRAHAQVHRVAGSTPGTDRRRVAARSLRNRPRIVGAEVDRLPAREVE